MAKKGLIKLAFVIIVVGALFLPSFIKYVELRFRKRGLEQRIEALKSQNKILESERRKLQTDINYIERKAREKIGVVRKGEIVIKEMAK